MKELNTSFLSPGAKELEVTEQTQASDAVWGIDPQSRWPRPGESVRNGSPGRGDILCVCECECECLCVCVHERERGNLFSLFLARKHASWKEHHKVKTTFIGFINSILNFEVLSPEHFWLNDIILFGF